MEKIPEVARQNTGNLDELYKQAHEFFPDFVERMESVLKKLEERDSLDFADVGIKIADIKERHKAQASTFADIAEEIGNQFEIIARKNRIAKPNKYGYRDDKINGALPNGHVCEVQCKVKEIEDVSDLTHEARDRANEIEFEAKSEDRLMDTQERTEYDFLRKLCLGIHNKAAIAGGLNKYLFPDLSEKRRLELSIVGFPVVHFKQVAQPEDNAPKPEVPIQLDEELSFSFSREETCEA
tara:strand:- start:11926 stop:12642 length:717 start_codon:yes stop_codon:yes gene_type:complete